MPGAGVQGPIKRIALFWDQMIRGKEYGETRFLIQFTFNMDRAAVG